MHIGMYAAALGSREEQKRLEVISNNIANAGTAGYKKDMARFEDFMFESTTTQMQQGPIRQTGEPLDVALSGTGFFKVESDNGVLYTRAGNLTRNAQGLLTTQEGWPVLGKNGRITVNSPTVRIESGGQVFDNGQAVGTLDLVQFPKDVQLVKVQNGYFKPSDPKQSPAAATNCVVQQGSLEGANFNVVEEMAQMIDAKRSFEAYQKVMQSFDQIDSQLMNKVAGS